jgi:RNA polymerase sigma-70 factor, ECF subfamily
MDKPALPADQILMEQIQNGDKRAFDQLYERYQLAIRCYLLRIVHSEVAADDLTQEVFLRVWTHAQQWSAKGPFKAWLYRIATYQAFNALRAIHRHPQQPLDDPEAQPAAEDESYNFQAWIVDTSTLEPDIAMEMAERQRQIWQLIGRLPEEKREVFSLVTQMEMSIQNVAERLGIPEGTVKSRLHYAKHWLSQNWPDQDW